MKKMIMMLASLFLVFDYLYAANISVDMQKKYQAMEGFGGGIVYYQGWLPAHPNKKEIYDTLFLGLDIELLRIGNWLQDLSNDISADVEIVNQAKARLGDKFKILMSSWSAPGELKVSGDVKGNGRDKSQNTLKKENGKYVYDKFAHWWKQSLLVYRSKGIDPDFISMQNEPDMNATYEETLFDPTENETIAGYAEALQYVSDSIRTLPNPPKICAPEVLGIGYGNFDKYASKLDKSKFDVYNYHLYHGGSYDNPDEFSSSMSVIKNNYSDKPNIMTEYCPLREPQETDMIAGARVIIHALCDANANGYINWELMWGEHSQMVAVEFPWDKSQWTTPKGYIISPEYHTIRHFSKFIDRGWQRIDVSSSDNNLKVVGFVNPENTKITLVIVNIANNDISTTINMANSFKLINYCQSKENGDKSKAIDPNNYTTNFNFPWRSITTLVYSSAATAIKNSLDNKVFEVYPNPAKDFVFVKFTKGNAKLYDCNQKFIKELKNGQNSVSDISKGLYVVILESNGKIISKKYLYITK